MRLLLFAPLLLGLAGCAGLVDSSAPGPERQRPTAETGGAVRDGQLGFKVTKVRISRSVHDNITDDSEKAKGQYVLVDVTVTNGATKRRYVMADEQQLLAGGQEYTCDIDATVLADKGPEVGLPEEINPGRAERIVIVFDVPRGVRPDVLEVHDSQDSGGALLRLR